MLIHSILLCFARYKVDMSDVLSILNDPNAFRIEDERLSTEIFEVLACRFPTLKDVKTFVESIDTTKSTAEAVLPLFSLLTYIETVIRQEYRDAATTYLNNYRNILSTFTLFPSMIVLIKIVVLYSIKRVAEAMGEEFCPSGGIPLEVGEMLNDIHNTGMCIYQLLLPSLMLGRNIVFPQYNSDMWVKKQSYHDMVTYITEEHSYLLRGEYTKGCAVM